MIEPRDAIGITGLSGKFPKSENIDELAENLYNHVDMVEETEARWPKGLYGLPSRMGLLKDLSKFDNQFFGFNGRQTNTMAPQSRLLMEVTFEALLDAGINPGTLRGSKTGVYLGFSTIETHEAQAENIEGMTGYVITGCHATMFANKISWALDLRGPSLGVDTACSSSLMAFHQAVLGLKNNECDLAIVGGVQLCLKPVVSLQLQRLGLLSPDGGDKSPDANANGLARSESCSVCVLQKCRDSKRIYAIVLGSHTNTGGYRESCDDYHNLQPQYMLLRELNEDLNVDPNDYIYYETYGTGQKIDDRAEWVAISRAICEQNKRSNPLLIGTIRNNMGHSEPASGMCSIAKICISFKNCKIPATLHSKQANENIDSPKDGLLKLCTEDCAIKSGGGNLVGINSLGYGGVNVNVILKNPRELIIRNDLDQVCVDSGIPRLVLVAGRTHEACQHMLDKIRENPPRLTADFLALLQSLFSKPIAGFNYRSFMLINPPDDNSQASGIETLKDGKENVTSIMQCLERQPLWFIIPGMGCHWAGMGNAMMKLPTFASSIFESATILKQFGLDLVDMITKPGENVNGDIMTAVMGLIATEIALVDCLLELDIKPDGFIGHSLGEFICGYLDGCLSREQILKALHELCICIQEEPRVCGKMAAVGLTWEETKSLCHGDLVAACHNCSDSVTISGPSDLVEQFVAKMTSENKFSRMVDSLGTAFHSPLMSHVEKRFSKKLDAIFVEPRERSSKWICSSVAESCWSSEHARFAGSNYWVNNLKAPVLFKEALEKAPENATFIEIAPHCLLQSVLKRSRNVNPVHIALMKRNWSDHDNLKLFFTSMGTLYNLGHQPKTERLYPQTKFPVDCNTRSISPLIKWDHSQSWLVTLYPDYFNPSSDSLIKCDISEPGQQYIADHCIDGRTLYPATGYLMLAWKALAKRCGKFQNELAVLFEDVSLHRATVLTEKTPTATFAVQFMEELGSFSISESDRLIVTGKISPLEGSQLKFQSLLEEQSDDRESIVLNSADFYKELRLRGYDYGPKFRCLKGFNMKSNRAKLIYQGEWVSFADSMMQVALMSSKSRALYLPVRLQSVRCDPVIFAQACRDNENQIKVVHNKNLNVSCAPGIEIKGLRCNLAPRNTNAQKPVLESYHFVHNVRSISLGPHEDKLIAGAYEAACARAIREIAKKIANPFKSLSNQKSLIAISEKESKSIDDEWYSKLMKNIPGDMRLLKSLRELVVIENDKQILKDNLIALLGNKNLIEADFLANIHTREQFLRPLIDIVLENINHDDDGQQSAFKVLELNATCRLVVQQFRKMIELNLRQPKQVSYTLANPNDPDVLREFNNEYGDFVNDSIKFDVSKSWRVPSEISQTADCDLIIYKDSPGDSIDSSNIKELMQSIFESIKPYGFAIVLTRSKLSTFEKLTSSSAIGNAELIMKFALDLGFQLIGESSDAAQTSRAFVMRKIAANLPRLSKQTLIQVKNHDYSWLDRLREAMLRDAADNENIWLIADDALNGLVGLIKCLRLEANGYRIRSIFNQTGESHLIQKYLHEIVKRNLVSNVLRLPAGHSACDIAKLSLTQISGSYRHLMLRDEDERQTIETNEAYLNVLSPGDLSSLRWIESPNKYWPQLRTRAPSDRKQQFCKIYYSPLNFRDIMLATGKLPPDALPGDLASQDCLFGLEFAGRDESGRRVMGCVEAKAIATSIIVDGNSDFLWPIPDEWSMEEASTIPVAYATAYYALIIRGKLNNGETVLIHSAAGGVGQAAISICLARGCRLFCTVGSYEKREYLKARFRELNDENFANSRDCSFEQDVMRLTNGRGCDLVLNSLSEDKLQASVRSLARQGRFLEIGKFDLSQDNPLGMGAFLKNISFEGILLDGLFATNANGQVPVVIKQQKGRVARLISDGLISGEVRPLECKLFDKSQVESAFRFMASGKHIGKVIVKIRDEEESSSNKNLKPSSNICSSQIVARTTFQPSKTYIITGGLGGFGLELAHWMVERGARNLVLTSRTGPRSGFQKMSIARLRSVDKCNLTIYTKPIKQTSDAMKLLNDLRAQGFEIGGIFNLAMVLRDALIENQTTENYEIVCKPKIDMTLAFDRASRELCKHPCDHLFVAFSSVSCGRGILGQTNYGFANSVLERVCEARRADGLHGLAIQWGAIGDAGVVSDTLSSDTRSGDINVGGTKPQRIRSCLATLDKLLNLNKAVCSSYVKAETSSRSQSAIRVASGSSKDDLTKLVCDILGVELSEVTRMTKLGDLGMDSLTGVEIQQALERQFSISMKMQNLRKLNLLEIEKRINKS